MLIQFNILMNNCFVKFVPLLNRYLEIYFSNILDSFIYFYINLNFL